MNATNATTITSHTTRAPPQRAAEPTARPPGDASDARRRRRDEARHRANRARSSLPRFLHARAPHGAVKGRETDGRCPNARLFVDSLHASSRDGTGRWAGRGEARDRRSAARTESTFPRPNRHWPRGGELCHTASTARAPAKDAPRVSRPPPQASPPARPRPWPRWVRSPSFAPTSGSLVRRAVGPRPPRSPPRRA